MVIHGERVRHVSSLCLAARVRGLLQPGCSRFLAYVLVTRVEAMPDMSMVPIVRYFPDVFP